VSAPLEISAPPAFADGNWAQAAPLEFTQLPAAALGARNDPSVRRLAMPAALPGLSTGSTI